MRRIGILGCGNIAGIIASKQGETVDITACHDRDRTRMSSYAKRTGAWACHSVAELLDADISILVEAASIEAVTDHLLEALDQSLDSVVLSVGAFADPEFLTRVRNRALAVGRRVHVPSGAIFALDNIKIARISQTRKLLLRTTKTPGALGLSETTPRGCIFRGRASEAVRLFPKNINVSMALYLAATIEPEVEIWVDPAATVNRHEIVFEGEFGTARIATENLPSTENPATSRLAALSVLALLEDLDNPVRIGT